MVALISFLTTIVSIGESRLIVTRNHAKPGEVVNLQPLGANLSDAKTTALVKAERFEAMRLIVRAGTEIPPHHVTGNLMLHCLEGHVVLRQAQSEVELTGGDWIYLNGGEIHSLKGLQDSSLLLTILFAT